MNALLYIITAILVIGWAVGFFLTDIGDLAHVLLAIALVAFASNLFSRPTRQTDNVEA